MRDIILPGSVLEVLKTIPDVHVNCIVTSPPYWGLRDYGAEGQIGLEDTPEKYTEKMVQVFRECRRVLKDDGTLWLNLGDSYAGSGKGDMGENTKILNHSIDVSEKYIDSVLKPKDLCGIPWRVAFALQADGWYLRQDIIWHKPNPMPKSVTDRCTKSHEYIFLLSKSQKYYYDGDSIKEKHKDTSWASNLRKNNIKEKQGKKSEYNSKTKKQAFLRGNPRPECGRNKRSVWTISPKPFPEAHFAVYPEKLIEPCIKAGCPGDGIVLDPFFGSGTTGLVAKKLGRHYIGIELNPEYIKIADKRLSKYTQQMRMI